MRDDTKNALRFTSDIFDTALNEINDSMLLLREANKHLTVMVFTRQVFELAKTLDIFIDNGEYFWLYYLEIRESELKKMPLLENDEEYLIFWTKGLRG